MFNVQPNYVTAVENFVFAEVVELSSIIISPDEMNEVVQEISSQIITASQMRPNFSTMAQRELSLRDIVYIIIQGQDQQKHVDTPGKIRNVTEKAKLVMGAVVKKLSKDFEQLTIEDLNKLTLLFGVHRICDLAHDRFISIPKGSQTEEIETALKELIALRKKYPEIAREDMPEAMKAFLNRVDQVIGEQTQRLAQLKLTKAA